MSDSLDGGGVAVWQPRRKPPMTKDPLAVIRPLVIILRDGPVSAEFYEDFASLLDTFTRNHEVFVVAPERKASKDNVSTIVHSARHTAEKEGWLRAQGEDAADEHLVLVVAHGVEDQSLAAAIVALPETGACCATMFLAPRVFPRAAFSIGRPSHSCMALAMEASHYGVCLHLMESCAHLAACNGVDATLDLRPCIVIPGAHHWQLMPAQTYSNRDVKRPKRGADSQKVHRQVAAATLAFIDVHAKRLLPKVRARQVLLSEIQASMVLLAPGLWATGFAGAELVLEAPGGEVILHRGAVPLHLPPEYGAVLQLSRPGAMADPSAIPSLVGAGPRHGSAHDEALAAAITRGAGSYTSRRTALITALCSNLQQGIIANFLQGDSALERQLDLHPGSLLKLRSMAHDKFRVVVTVFETAAGFLRETPDARLTTSGEVEVQVRCFLHQPDSRWHVPEDIDADDAQAVAASAQHRRALRTAYGDALPAEELWVKVARYDALASMAKRFILPDLRDVSPIPLHELKFEASAGSDWSWTDATGGLSSDAEGSSDSGESGASGSSAASLYEEISMDMLDSGALEAVRLNSAMPPGSEFSDRDPESDSDWGRDDSETAGNGDSWRRASVTSSAAGRAVEEPGMRCRSSRGTPGTRQRLAAGVGLDDQARARRKLLRKVPRDGKMLDERHRILRRRKKPKFVEAEEGTPSDEPARENEEPAMEPIESEEPVADAPAPSEAERSFEEEARPKSGIVRTYIGLFDSSSVGVGTAAGAATLRPTPPPARGWPVPQPPAEYEPAHRIESLATSFPEWRNPLMGPGKPPREAVYNRLRMGNHDNGGDDGEPVELVDDLTRLCVTRGLRQLMPSPRQQWRTAEVPPVDAEGSRSLSVHESEYSVTNLGAADKATTELSASPRSVLEDGDPEKGDSMPTRGEDITAAIEVSVGDPRAETSFSFATSTVQPIAESSGQRPLAETAEPCNEPAALGTVASPSASHADRTQPPTSPRSRSLLSRISGSLPTSESPIPIHPRLYFNQQLSKARDKAPNITSPARSPRQTSGDGAALRNSLPKLGRAPGKAVLGPVPPLWEAGAIPDNLRPMAPSTPRSAYMRAHTMSEPSRPAHLAQHAQVSVRRVRPGSNRKGTALSSGRWDGSVTASPRRGPWNTCHRAPVEISSSGEAQVAREAHTFVNRHESAWGNPVGATSYHSPRQAILAAAFGSDGSVTMRTANFQLVTKLRRSSPPSVGGKGSSLMPQSLTTAGSATTRRRHSKAGSGRGGSSPVFSGITSDAAVIRRTRLDPVGLGDTVSRKSVNFGRGAVDPASDFGDSERADGLLDDEPSSSGGFGVKRDVLIAELTSSTVKGEDTAMSVGAKSRGEMQRLRQERSAASAVSGTSRDTVLLRAKQKYANSTRLLGKNAPTNKSQAPAGDAADSLAGAASVSEQAAPELARSKTHKVVARREVDTDDIVGALSGIMSATQTEKHRRQLLADDAAQAAKIQSIMNLTKVKRGDDSLDVAVTAAYNISLDAQTALPLWEAKALAETLYKVAIQIVPEAVRSFHTAEYAGSAHKLQFSNACAVGAKQLISGPLHLEPTSGRGRLEVHCPQTADGLLRCPSLGALVQHMVVDYNMASPAVEALVRLEVDIK